MFGQITTVQDNGQPIWASAAKRRPRLSSNESIEPIGSRPDNCTRLPKLPSPDGSTAPPRRAVAWIVHLAWDWDLQEPQLIPRCCRDVVFWARRRALRRGGDTRCWRTLLSWLVFSQLATGYAPGSLIGGGARLGRLAEITNGRQARAVKCWGGSILRPTVYRRVERTHKPSLP